MRLERADPAVTPESTAGFINQTLKMLELTDIEDLQVTPPIRFLAFRVAVSHSACSHLFLLRLGWNRSDWRA